MQSKTMSNTIYTKQCTKCKEIKSIDDFYKSKNGKYGVRSYCKQCHKQHYYIDNKETVLKGQKQYNSDNKDKRRKQAKKYYIDNKDRIKEYRKQHYIDNKDRINTHHKQYRIDNKDRIKEYKKQYSKSFAIYETYHYQLTIDEEPKLSNDGIYLEVKCKYCGKYFKPTNIQVRCRIDAINGVIFGDNSLYCSDGCKKSCGTYKKVKYPDGFKTTTSREVQPALRKLVLERDNWQCQKCGDEEELHCHHYDGIEVNPIESADIDNCITLCKKCHKAVHKQDGCSMRRESC